MLVACACCSSSRSPWCLSKRVHVWMWFVQAFSVVFEQAIDRAEPAEEVKQRVVNLIDSITYSVFVYTTRGLFERDKLIFTAQMTFLVSI